MQSYTACPEVRAAGSRVFKWAGPIYEAGLDLNEVRHDLIVFLVDKRQLFDPDKANLDTFLFFIAQRYIWRRIEEAEALKRRAAQFRPRSRVVEPEPMAGEQAAHIRMLMLVLSPKRRLMVTLWAAGWTLARLGKRFKLTRERCRQIINRGLRLMKDEAKRIAHKAGVSADEYWSDFLCRQ